MKLYHLLFLFVSIPLFTGCPAVNTGVEVPWQEHGWACQGNRTQPHKVYRQQFASQWRLGWAPTNAEDPINFGPYTWSSLSEVPGFHQQFEVNGEKWLIIDIISEQGGANSASTDKKCTSACRAYCKFAGGAFSGGIAEPGTSLSHCGCKFN